MMLRNIILAITAYIVLGSFIYITFLYDRSSVKTLKDVTFHALDFPLISNINSKGEKTGTAIDMLDYVFKKNNYGSPNIVFAPLNSALKDTLNSRKNAILSTIRTQDKESLFKWVGPVFSCYRNVYVLKENKDKYKNNITKIKFAVVDGLFDENILLNNFVPKNNITIVENPKSAMKMLLSKKVDAIILSKILLKSFESEKLSSIYNLGVANFYLAFNINTPNKIISKLQKDVDEYKNSKEYKNNVKICND